MILADLKQDSLLRPEYVREPSHPLLCVPACLNMILVRRGYLPIPQAEIVHKFGVAFRVPERLSETYPQAGVSENPSDWGLEPRAAELAINAVLAEHAPKLKHVFRHWQRVPRAAHLEFIMEHLAMDNDIAVGFRASDVYEGTEPVGHVALIMAVDSAMEQIRLMDPEIGTNDGFVVPWSKLFSGIVAVRDGYWLFGERTESLKQLHVL